MDDFEVPKKNILEKLREYFESNEIMCGEISGEEIVCEYMLSEEDK